MNTKVTKELIERQMGAKGFSSNAAPLKRLTDPLQDTPMVVTLDQLHATLYMKRSRHQLKPVGWINHRSLHVALVKIITS